MRGTSGFSDPGLSSQGLALRFRQMNLKSLRLREISERKQVGDAESMVNEGISASGHHGFFKGEGGEV
jgi:hypothetical protein